MANYEIIECIINLHSKNTRVSVTRKKVHWAQTPFRVNDDPEVGQLSTDVTNNGVRFGHIPRQVD